MAANTDLDALRDQHLERVYSLFEGKAKSFRWMLFGLIGLALVFFSLIAFTYITLLDEGPRIRQELDQLAAEIAAAAAAREHLAAAGRMIGDLRQKAHIERQRMTDFMWVQTLEQGAAAQGRKVSRLKHRFRDHPEFAAWAAGAVLRPEPSPQFLHSHPDIAADAREPCAWLEGVRWQRCRADVEIATFHPGGPGRWSVGDREVASVVESARLQADLDELVASVRAWLSGTEPAWRRNVQQASLRGEMSLFWRAYDDALSTHAARLQAKDAERAAAIEEAASSGTSERTDGA